MHVQESVLGKFYENVQLYFYFSYIIMLPDSIHKLLSNLQAGNRQIVLESIPLQVRTETAEKGHGSYGGKKEFW